MDREQSVLLGMNNPLSSEPRYALAPFPERSTGWRVLQLLREGLSSEPPTRSQYMAAFDRRNVLHSRAWSAREARAVGAALLPQLAGRRVVVLGVQTLAALGLPRPTWGAWAHHGPSLLDRDGAMTAYCVLPHPSGLCREYNDPEVRRVASRVLAGEYARAAT